VRFACQKYTSEDLHAFVHLTNNSVSKHKKVDWENEEQRFFGKNMWSSEQFSGYLKEQAGYDVYHEKIKPKIKDLAIWTMSSSQVRAAESRT
jgi:hypothetical protein